MQEFIRDITIYMLLFAVIVSFSGVVAAIVAAYATWCVWVKLESMPPMRLGWQIGRLQVAFQVAA